MSHESGDGSECVTRDRANAYKMLKERVTIVIQRENGDRGRSCARSEAAGQGFEPQLPGPEPGVLPLDDPATGARSLAGQG